MVLLARFVSEIFPLKPRTTRGAAEMYFSAIIDRDRERALSLMRLEILCSGAGMTEQVDLQLARFGSAEVRDVSINVRDLTGSVAYNPGTEGAQIRFEYRPPGEPDWRVGEFGVVTFEYPYKPYNFRAICWLWTAEEP